MDTVLPHQCDSAYPRLIILLITPRLFYFLLSLPCKKPWDRKDKSVRVSTLNRTTMSKRRLKQLTHYRVKLVAETLDWLGLNFWFILASSSKKKSKNSFLIMVQVLVSTSQWSLLPSFTLYNVGNSAIFLGWSVESFFDKMPQNCAGKFLQKAVC